MATAALLGANQVKWKPQSFILLPPLRPLPVNSIKLSSAMSNKPFDVKLRCFSSSSSSSSAELTDPNSSHEFQSCLVVKDNPANPLEIIGLNLKALRKPAIVAVVLGLLVMFDPNQALADSIGRVGSSLSLIYLNLVLSVIGFGMSYCLFLFGVPSKFEWRLSAFLKLCFLNSLGVAFAYWAYSMSTSSVLKLQVAFLSTGRTLQRDLDRITKTTDTGDVDCHSSFNHVLTETSVALLRQLDYCIAGHSSVMQKFFNNADGRNCFNQLRIEERRKCDDETLVNVNKWKTESKVSKSPNGSHSQYTVVTILVFAYGRYELPTINDSADLKEALQKLGSIRCSGNISAIEVLWTPQKETDSLSEQKLNKDYPLLRNF